MVDRIPRGSIWKPRSDRGNDEKRVRVVSIEEGGERVQVRSFLRSGDGPSDPVMMYADSLTKNYTRVPPGES